MCYDIKASLEAQLKRAKRRGDADALKQIQQKLLPFTDLPLFHASGFSHPKILIYTHRSPDFPEVSQWGLVPHWIKDRVQLQKFWNNTLNARGETIFEKPSFRDAAKDQRCLIYLDGFFEHHHFQGNSYPYFIESVNNEPLIVGGLYNEWVDRETGEMINTFSIVTTKGNTLLSRIHNNPKLDGPRMPLLLLPDEAESWLQNIDDPLDQKEIESLMQPYPEALLKAHTVQKLRGKNYLGNVPEVIEEVRYLELEESI